MSGDSPPTIALASPVTELASVSSHLAGLLQRLGIATVADLIKHLPHRYEYHAGRTPIAELPVGSIASATGQVAECRWIPGQRKFGRRAQGRFHAVIEDDTGQLDVIWFNARYLIDKLIAGMDVALTGKVDTYLNNRQMVNPKWRTIDPDAGSADGVADEGYHPVYPATEGLTSDQIHRLVADVLPIALPQIEDHLDEAFRNERGLPGLAEAYRMIHAPTDEDEPKTARRRLAYDELLMLQTGLAAKRHHTRTQLKAPALNHSDAIDAEIRRRFPFTLTDAQDHVVKQIAADLQRTEPANRLLQGDVGSGKTVVALYAMLMATADRRQAALMAPTELLAEQHYQSISAMLEGTNVRLALLTGSLDPRERQAALNAIEQGEVDIAIGTHALLTESVVFNDLAVVVIDEQHRFGVVQRAAIRSKSADGTTVPHTLVMTATPIPRTLSLSLFGDMDVSTIDSLPPGRQPIDTRVVGPDKTDTVYEYMARRVAAGEQLYIVVPAIDEGEANLKAVRTHARELQATWFADKRLAAVHGQLDRATREAIMYRFRRGVIDVLVATTVIEVGVDVSNASLMIVEHAERFGLAQLHQLRGRIGRGNKRSLCTFIADPTTEDAAGRMTAIARTTDGFKIAEADLEIRGMGELIGTRQSGLPPLKVAKIPDDMELLQLARRDARAIIEADPVLSHDSHILFRGRMLKQYGEALGLGDVM